ncbi:Uncharacterised protein [Vibrio cholerae]|nr:Uncharacterised protein [Vibrio cholerae]
MLPTSQTSPYLRTRDETALSLSYCCAQGKSGWFPHTSSWR